MLCGLPVPSIFKRKPKRTVRPAISKPFPQGSPSMNDARGFTDGGSDNDSGVYYLVTSRTTGDKRLVKRPKAPLTSQPMDDDFDAYTHTGYDNISRFAPDHRDLDLSRSRSQGHAPAEASMSYATKSPAAHARSPTYDMGSGLGSASTRQPRNAMMSPPADRHVPSPQQQQHSAYPYESSQVGSSKGKARQDVKTYGEYQEYMHEIDKMFSPVGDFDVRVNRVNEASGNRESVALGRVLSARSNRPRGGGGSASLGGNASTNTQPKKKGQPAFEEVSRRVVENTPEKTVTISTWREQVAKEAAVERTSVYYEGFLQTYPRSEMDDIARGSKSSGNASGRHGMIDEAPLYEHHRSRSEGQNSFSRDYAPPDKRRSPDLDHQVQGHDAYPTSPQQHKQAVKSPPPQGSSPISSSSSSIPSSQLPPTPPPKPPRLSIKTIDMTMQQSTPLGQHGPIPSFAPTKDGSIISTIRSTSSATSQTFGGILSSCKPPLTHLSPVLEKLGITTVEHLKAFAELSPEIRDRELKEEALKLGFTVMEWAILVDRLRTLSS